jgi:hypothetical protein
MFQEVCSRIWKVFPNFLCNFLKVGIILEVNMHLQESSQRVLSKALRTGNLGQFVAISTQQSHFLIITFKF